MKLGFRDFFNSLKEIDEYICKKFNHLFEFQVFPLSLQVLESLLQKNSSKEEIDRKIQNLGKCEVDFDEFYPFLDKLGPEDVEFFRQFSVHSYERSGIADFLTKLTDSMGESTDEIESIHTEIVKRIISSFNKIHSYLSDPGSVKTERGKDSIFHPTQLDRYLYLQVGIDFSHLSNPQNNGDGNRMINHWFSHLASAVLSSENHSNVFQKSCICQKYRIYQKTKNQDNIIDEKQTPPPEKFDSRVNTLEDILNHSDLHNFREKIRTFFPFEEDHILKKKAGKVNGTDASFYRKYSRRSWHSVRNRLNFGIKVRRDFGNPMKAEKRYSRKLSKFGEKIFYTPPSSTETEKIIVIQIPLFLNYQICQFGDGYLMLTNPFFNDAKYLLFHNGKFVTKTDSSSTRYIQNGYLIIRSSRNLRDRDFRYILYFQNKPVRILGLSNSESYFSTNGSFLCKTPNPRRGRRVRTQDEQQQQGVELESWEGISIDHNVGQKVICSVQNGLVLVNPFSPTYWKRIVKGLIRPYNSSALEEFSDVLQNIIRRNVLSYNPQKLKSFRSYSRTYQHYLLNLLYVHKFTTKGLFHTLYKDILVFCIFSYIPEINVFVDNRNLCGDLSRLIYLEYLKEVVSENNKNVVDSQSPDSSSSATTFFFKPLVTQEHINCLKLASEDNEYISQHPIPILEALETIRFHFNSNVNNQEVEELDEIESSILSDLNMKILPSKKESREILVSIDSSEKNNIIPNLFKNLFISRIKEVLDRDIWNLQKSLFQFLVCKESKITIVDTHSSLRESIIFLFKTVNELGIEVGEDRGHRFAGEPVPSPEEIKKRDEKRKTNLRLSFLCDRFLTTLLSNTSPEISDYSMIDLLNTIVCDVQFPVNSNNKLIEGFAIMKGQKTMDTYENYFDQFWSNFQKKKEEEESEGEEEEEESKKGVIIPERFRKSFLSLNRIFQYCTCSKKEYGFNDPNSLQTEELVRIVKIVSKILNQASSFSDSVDVNNLFFNTFYDTTSCRDENKKKYKPNKHLYLNEEDDYFRHPFFYWRMNCIERIVEPFYSLIIDDYLRLLNYDQLFLRTDMGNKFLTTFRSSVLMVKDGLFSFEKTVPFYAQFLDMIMKVEDEQKKFEYLYEIFKEDRRKGGVENIVSQFYGLEEKGPFSGKVVEISDQDGYSFGSDSRKGKKVLEKYRKDEEWKIYDGEVLILKIIDTHLSYNDQFIDDEVEKYKFKNEYLETINSKLLVLFLNRYYLSQSKKSRLNPFLYEEFQPFPFEMNLLVSNITKKMKMFGSNDHNLDICGSNETTEKFFRMYGDTKKKVSTEVPVNNIDLIIRQNIDSENLFDLLVLFHYLYQNHGIENVFFTVEGGEYNKLLCDLVFKEVLNNNNNIESSILHFFITTYIKEFHFDYSSISNRICGLLTETPQEYIRPKILNFIMKIIPKLKGEESMNILCSLLQGIEKSIEEESNENNNNLLLLKNNFKPIFENLFENRRQSHSFDALLKLVSVLCSIVFKISGSEALQSDEFLPFYQTITSFFTSALQKRMFNGAFENLGDNETAIKSFFQHVSYSYLKPILSNGLFEPGKSPYEVSFEKTDRIPFMPTDRVYFKTSCPFSQTSRYYPHRCVYHLFSVLVFLLRKCDKNRSFFSSLDDINLFFDSVVFPFTETCLDYWVKEFGVQSETANFGVDILTVVYNHYFHLIRTSDDGDVEFKMERKIMECITKPTTVEGFCWNHNHEGFLKKYGFFVRTVLSDERDERIIRMEWFRKAIWVPYKRFSSVEMKMIGKEVDMWGRISVLLVKMRSKNKEEKGEEEDEEEGECLILQCPRQEIVDEEGKKRRERLRAAKKKARAKMLSKRQNWENRKKKRKKILEQEEEEEGEEENNF